MSKRFLITTLLFLILIPAAFAQVSSFSLNLSKTEYAQNKSLAGNLLVKFTDSVEKDAFIEFVLGGITQKLSLAEVFDKIPVSYNATQKKTELLNFSPEITFDFPDKGKQTFGLELPKNAGIKGMEFKMAGLERNGVYPKSPKLDFGDSSYYGVEYFGSKLGWSQQAYTGKGLNLLATNIGIMQVTKDDIAKNFCEVITIPKTKHVLVNLRYRLKDNMSDFMNLTAGIYSYDGLMLIGSNICQLPYPTTSMEWRGCEIFNQQFIFEGEYYACFTVEYAPDNANYELNFESSGNVSSSYSCYGLGGCQSGYPNDYFITINSGVYDSRLNSEISVSNWTTISPQYAQFQIESYLEGCVPYDETQTRCIVPVVLETETAGKIRVKDLHLLYETGTISAESNLFSNIRITPAKITSVGNVPLSNYSVSIPLSIFDRIRTPPSPGAYALVINSSFGKSSEGKIHVIENLSYAKPVIEGGLERIEEVKGKLSAPDPQLTDILHLFGVETSALLSALETKKQLLQTILLSTDEDEKKKTDSENVLKNVDDLLENVPQTVVGLSKVIDSVILTSPQQIPDEVATAVDKDEVYQYQDRVEVLYEIKDVVIVDFLDNRIEGTLVKKTVKPKTDLENIEIFEVIPKQIASDLTKVKFSENPIVVANDPIAKWNVAQLSANSPKEIMYFVQGKHANQAQNFLTIVVSNATLPSKAPVSICGDGVCSVDFEDQQTCPQDCKSKLPLVLIAVILSILVVAIFFILFFKKMKVFIVGNPFESEKDLEGVRNYIASALEKKMDEESIKSALLTKGWTNQQIAYAFKTVKDAALKEEEGGKVAELAQFIDLKLQEGMKENQIKKLALEKGWKKDIVKKILSEKSKSLKNSASKPESKKGL